MDGSTVCGSQHRSPRTKTLKKDDYVDGVESLFNPVLTLSVTHQPLTALHRCNCSFTLVISSAYIYVAVALDKHLYFRQRQSDLILRCSIVGNCHPIAIKIKMITKPNITRTTTILSTTPFILVYISVFSRKYTLVFFEVVFGFLKWAATSLSASVH